MHTSYLVSLVSVSLGREHQIVPNFFQHSQSIKIRVNCIYNNSTTLMYENDKCSRRSLHTYYQEHMRGWSVFLTHIISYTAHILHLFALILAFVALHKCNDCTY